jgi:hypothetical protein
MTCPDCPDSTETYAEEATHHGIDTITTEVTVHCRGCDRIVHQETETRLAKHRPY